VGVLNILTIIGSSVTWIKTDWIVGGQWRWKEANHPMYSWLWCSNIKFPMRKIMDVDTFLQEGYWKIQQRFNEH